MSVTSLLHHQVKIMASQLRNDTPLDDRPKRGKVRLIRDLQQLEEDRTLAKFARARKALDQLDHLIARLEQLGKDDQDFKGR